jgi:hypothetical protein
LLLGDVLVLHLLGHLEQLVHVEQDHLGDRHRRRVAVDVARILRLLRLLDRAGRSDAVELVLDRLVVLLSSFEDCETVGDYSIDFGVELFITQSLEELYQNDEDLLGNGALSFDLLLFGIPFGLLLLSGVARAFASLLDHVDDAHGQQVVDEKELVDHILLTIFLGVEQFLSLVLLDALFRELVDVFDQELRVAGKVKRLTRRIRGHILGVHSDLTQKMEILHVAVLVDLCDFKVVDFLNHLLELGHNLHLLCFLADASLRKHTLDWLRNDLGRKLECLCGRLALEDNADQELHAQSNDGFLLCAVDINCVGQLNHLLEETSLDQAAHDLLVSDLLQFETCAGLLCLVVVVFLGNFGFTAVGEWNLDDEF